MVVCVASTNCFLHAYARLPMSQRRTVGAWLRGNDDFCCTSGARLRDSFCIRRAMLTSESRQPINRTSHLGSLVHLRTCNQSPPRGSIRAWRCSLISRRGRRTAGAIAIRYHKPLFGGVSTVVGIRRIVLPHFPHP